MSCRCAGRKPVTFFLLLLCAVVVAGGYGFCSTPLPMHGPRLDSLILTFSVLAQFMLMGRRIENWYVWLAVNTGGATVYDARFKLDRRFIFPVLD